MYGVLKTYYVILIYSIFGQYIFNVPDIVSDVLVVGFIALSLCQDRYQLHVPRKLGNYCLSIIIVPAIVILAFSLTSQLFQSLSTDYLVRSTTLCVRWVLYCVLGLRTVYVFGEKSADMLLVSCLVAYIPTIVIYFVQNGIVAGFNILFSSDAYSESIVLEVHRMTYVFGFLSVYYLYKWIISKDRVLPQMLLSIVLLLLGVKRIANFALILILAFLLLIKFLKNDERRYRFTCVLAVITVLIPLLYVFAIKSGGLRLAFEHFGIEDSFRFNFWNHISSEYEFSVGFLGKGISYSQRFMWNEWSNIKDLSAATNLHNDILSYYIGLGFIGFVGFFGLFFVGQTVLLKRWFSVKSALFAFALSSYYFVIMATSNEGLPGFVYGCYMMLIFAVASSEDEALSYSDRRKANE